jgi:integrase
VIENVFRPSRIRDGKRIVSRLYSGRYTLGRGQRVLTVALETPDEQVARKKLRDLIVEKQREAVGLIAPKIQREALLAPLASLVTEYSAVLRRKGVTGAYSRDTLYRLLRILDENRWQHLGDIRPEAFQNWMAGLKCSAKTAREYQISINAFLNHLVEVERLERNPLGKIPLIKTRGKEVRPPRAYTETELKALFSVQTGRAQFYRVLFYMGARKGEVASLVWGDLELSLVGHSKATIRASTTKTKIGRVVPIHPELAKELLAVRPAASRPDSPVFEHVPTRKQLLSDFDRAGIERKDRLGRVVHFHAFRMTARTMAIRAGASERVCDEVLGHENGHRMGSRYTDMSAVPLLDWLRLPWLGAGQERDAQLHSQSEADARTVVALMAELLRSVLANRDCPVPEGNSRDRTVLGSWSGRQDSNLRPPGPKPGALPG